MYLQEASLVSPTQPQASGSGKRMSATSGRKCLEQFGRLPRAGSWAKTFAGLLIGMEGWYSTRCRLTWKLKGTRYNRFYFQLQVSTPRMKGTEYGLLPTPTTDSVSNRSKPYAQGGMPLALFANLLPTPTASTGGANHNSAAVTERGHGINLQGAVMKLLPTPRAPTNNGIGYAHQAHKGRLEDVVAAMMLPTPQARDYKSPDKPGSGNFKRKTQNGYTIDLNSLAPLLLTPTTNDAKNATMPDSQKHRDGLTGEFFHLKTGSSSRLNPRFVMEMMGFSPNHCDNAFEKIAWELYLRKKSTKSFQKRLQNGETKLSKLGETP